jgi:hypothetical protein
MQAVSGALLGGWALADAVGVQLQSVFFPVDDKVDAYIKDRAKSAHLEGKLFKYELQRKVWKERSFILSKNKLMWLTLKGEQGRGAVGDIKNDMVLQLLEITLDPEAASKPEGGFTFRVACKPLLATNGAEILPEQARVTSVILAASTTADIQRWIDAINSITADVPAEKFVAEFSKSTNICQLSGTWGAAGAAKDPEGLEGLAVSDGSRIVGVCFQHTELNGYPPLQSTR